MPLDPNNAGIKEGNWVWSDDFSELVKIIENKFLWGYQQCEVFVPSKNLVLPVDIRHLKPRMPSQHLEERIMFVATLSKVINLLTESPVISPLDSKIIPLPHQLIVLKKAVELNTFRYLLADEVGLGKTIEAGLIFRELKIKGLVKRALILCPKGLTMQWVQEMKTRFGENFKYIPASDFSTLSTIFGDENPWHHFNQVVLSFDSVKPMESRKGWSQEEVSNYNQQRIQSLSSAGWDLLIIDEAHRVGGSTPSVARYQLAKMLSETIPYVLLLSATPHQGKSDSFQRLLSLLDKDLFLPNTAIKPDMLIPYVFRNEKRTAIDNKGKPLFTPRSSKLVKVRWGSKHRDQEDLYNKVTEYVKEGYNQAISERKNYLGFLMILMQKMVSSSTRAIHHALQKRLDLLNNYSAIQQQIDFDITELDSQEQYELLISSEVGEVDNEREQVSELLKLAEKCEALSHDARAEMLLEIIYQQQAEENDINLKFLIFTEFVATQQMLKEFLEKCGFSCAILNGSMDLEERNAVQKEFSKNVKILISTDAGGEGLNLQFCHIVINYDLPWNPMRIEQRIGRVDRIGQIHPVKAFNFIFENSVEDRINMVIQDKLNVIMSEFGVDKTSDLLDSESLNYDFEKYFLRSISNPSEIEKYATELATSVKNEINQEHRRALPVINSVDPNISEGILSNPFYFLLKKTARNYLLMKNIGPQQKNDDRPFALSDNKTNVSSNSLDAKNDDQQPFSMEDAIIKEMMRCYRQWAINQPLPSVALDDLPEGVEGLFTLWMVSISGTKELQYVFPILMNNEKRVLKSSAIKVWEKLLEGPIHINGCESKLPSDEYAIIFNEAIQIGKEIFLDLLTKRNELFEREKNKLIYSLKLTREKAMQIGLEGVRSAKLKEIENLEQSSLRQLCEKYDGSPSLTPILALKVARA